VARRLQQQLVRFQTIVHFTLHQSVRKPRPTDVQMRIILRPTRSRCIINNNNNTIWQTCAYYNNYYLLQSREAPPRAVKIDHFLVFTQSPLAATATTWRRRRRLRWCIKNAYIIINQRQIMETLEGGYLSIQQEFVRHTFSALSEHSRGRL